ncbi:MAG: hypothetical protein AAF514_16485 [Verrucomicrobiota bacterium]
MGEPAEAFALLTPEVGQRSPKWFKDRARLLHVAGKHEEALAWLSTPHPEVRLSSLGFMKGALLTERALETGTAKDQESALATWKETLGVAKIEGRAEGLYRLATAVGNLNGGALRLEAMAEALKCPGPHPPVERLRPVFQWLYQNNQEEDLRQVFRSLRRRQPDSLLLANNLAYLDLIEGRSWREVVDRIAPLRAKRPEIAEFSTTLGLAHLVGGDPETALSFLQPVAAHWKLAPPSARAAYLVAMKATGTDDAPAEVLEENIRWDLLLTSEKIFFRRLLEIVGTIR